MTATMAGDLAGITYTIGKVRDFGAGDFPGFFWVSHLFLLKFLLVSLEVPIGFP